MRLLGDAEDLSPGTRDRFGSETWISYWRGEVIAGACSALSLSAGLLMQHWCPNAWRPLYVTYAAVAGIGVVGLAGLLVLAVSRVLREDWLGVNSGLLAQAQTARDERGERRPASTRSLEGSALDRVSLAVGSDRKTAVAAARTLPSKLWPRAVRTLLHSRWPEVRVVGVGCSPLSREVLLRLYRRDRDTRVAEAAWDRAGGVRTEQEGLRALRSRHPEIRRRVVAAGVLARARVLAVCRDDPEQTVRAEVWSCLRADLSRVEAAALVGSRADEIRREVVASGLLSRGRLMQCCERDGVEAVRQAAWQLLSLGLSPEECAQLSRARHEDVRLAVAGHALTPREVLCSLAGDPETTVRRLAHSRLLPEATADELRLLAASPDAAARIEVARHPRAHRELLVCFTSDADGGVRAAAWEGLRVDLTESEAALLSGSHDGEIRRAAVVSSLLPRESLLQCCRQDEDSTVRQAAWDQVSPDLSSHECAWLSRARHEDVRLAVAGHALTPRRTLHSLLRGSRSAARRWQPYEYVPRALRASAEETRAAALARLVPEMTPRECARLARSRCPDVRRAAADHPVATSRALRRLRKDRDDLVRERAAGRLAANAGAREVARLARSRDAVERIVAARNANAPRDLLLALLDDLSSQVREAAMARVLTSFTPEEFDRFRNSPHEDVRAALTRDPGTPRAVLLALVEDVRPEVREGALARLLDTATEQELRRLSGSAHEEIRAAAADHPRTPREALVQIVLSQAQPSPYPGSWRAVRPAAPSSPPARMRALARLLESASEAELRQFSASPHADVKEAIAAHPTTPRDVLITLSQDPVEPVQVRALARVLEEVSEAELVTMAKSASAPARAAAARVNRLPREALRPLATDHEAVVRAVALPRFLSEASVAEVSELLQWANSQTGYQFSQAADEVSRTGQEWVRGRLGQPGDEPVLPHVRDQALRRELVTSVVARERERGVGAVIAALGADLALQLVDTRSLGAFFRRQGLDAIAKIIGGLAKESRSIRIGTDSIEEQDYDSYGSYSSTHTRTEDRVLAVTYFHPVVVERLRQALRTLDPHACRAVLAGLAEDHAEIAALLQPGLGEVEWRDRSFGDVLRQVRAIRDTSFTAASDKDIISLLEAERA